jgi:23S rRNA (uracil1939-C5)-methyltransferase
MALPIAENEWNGKIETISQEGLGVGTVQTMQDGKRLRRPIFVPFTVPGDKITARIIEQKRKYAFGELATLETPSAQRVEPKCPHFTVCGGCNLQHIAYEEQLKQKGQQIQFLLTRKGAALPHDVAVLPSKQRHNYRWRAKIAVEFTGGRIIAGFRKFHAHDVVPVKVCYIVAPEIVQLITMLGGLDSKLGLVDRFTQEVIVVVGENRKLGVLVPLDDVPPQTRKQVREFFEELYGRNRKLIGNLFFEENRATKTSGQVQEHITYKAAGLTFSFLPETFIQSNVSTNETLIATAIEFLFKDRDAAKCTVIDLYAGLGNVSLPIAKKAANVIAVEGHEASVLLGRINSYQNGINNTLFLHRSTERYIFEYVKHAKASQHDEDYPKADMIIIDPPRTGCTSAVLQGLLNSNIKRVVYISCNPVTLANDLTVLSAKYGISDIRGVDMFPDISHVETVVQLDRRQ